MDLVKEALEKRRCSPTASPPTKRGSAFKSLAPTSSFRRRSEASSWSSSGIHSHRSWRLRSSWLSLASKWAPHPNARFLLGSGWCSLRLACRCFFGCSFDFVAATTTAPTPGSPTVQGRPIKGMATRKEIHLAFSASSWLLTKLLLLFHEDACTFVGWRACQATKWCLFSLLHLRLIRISIPT